MNRKVSSGTGIGRSGPSFTGSNIGARTPKAGGRSGTATLVLGLAQAAFRSRLKNRRPNVEVKEAATHFLRRVQIYIADGQDDGCRGRSASWGGS